MAGGETAGIGADRGVTVVLLVVEAVGIRIPEDRQAGHRRCPGSRVENPVIVGVQVVAVIATEAADQHEGDVVAALVVQVDDQVGHAERVGLLRDQEESIGPHAEALKADDLLDATTLCGREAVAVADDQDRHPIEGCTGRSDQLDVFIQFGAGLLGPDLVECDLSVDGRGQDRREGGGCERAAMHQAGSLSGVCDVSEGPTKKTCTDAFNTIIIRSCQRRFPADKGTSIVPLRNPV